MMEDERKAHGWAAIERCYHPREEAMTKIG